jgi:excisionase family DNA binding protein
VAEGVPEGGGEELLTVKAAAALLGMHENVLRHWIYKGAIGAVKVGTGAGATWRIPGSGIDAFMAPPSPRSSPTRGEPGGTR